MSIVPTSCSFSNRIQVFGISAKLTAMMSSFLGDSHLRLIEILGCFPRNLSGSTTSASMTTWWVSHLVHRMFVCLQLLAMVAWYLQTVFLFLAHRPVDIVGDPEVFTSLSYYNTGIGQRHSIFCLIIYCGYLVLASCFFIEGCSWMGCGSRQMNSMGFLSNTILEWRALTVASTSCPLK